MASSPVPELEVRSAGHPDRDDILALLDAAAAEIAPNRGGADLLAERDASPAPRLDQVERVIGGSGHMVMVGCLDTVVVAIAIGHVERRPWPGDAAVVDVLYVDARAREIGVGEALLEAVMRWAIDSRCASVDAEALPGDRATKNFFETFGLVARKLVVSRRLATVSVHEEAS